MDCKHCGMEMEVHISGDDAIYVCDNPECEYFEDHRECYQEIETLDDYETGRGEQ